MSTIIIAKNFGDKKFGETVFGNIGEKNLANRRLPAFLMHNSSELQNYYQAQGFIAIKQELASCIYVLGQGLHHSIRDKVRRVPTRNTTLSKMKTIIVLYNFYMFV